MIWPSNYIPRFVSKRSEIHVQTKTYMQVFMVSLITIAKTWNNSNVQQQVKGKSSVIYPYNGMPLNAIKDVMSQKQAEQKKRDSGGQPGWFNLYEILERAKLISVTKKQISGGFPGGSVVKTYLLVQETQVRFLTWENLRCRGTAKPALESPGATTPEPLRCSCWACEP